MKQNIIFFLLFKYLFANLWSDECLNVLHTIKGCDKNSQDTGTHVQVAVHSEMRL